MNFKELDTLGNVTHRSKLMLLNKENIPCNTMHAMIPLDVHLHSQSVILKLQNMLNTNFDTCNTHLGHTREQPRGDSSGGF